MNNLYSKIWYNYVYDKDDDLSSEEDSDSVFDDDNIGTNDDRGEDDDDDDVQEMEWPVKRNKFRRGAL